MAISPFDPIGSEAVLAERMLGGSYELIKFVVQNIAQIRAISDNIDEVIRLFASVDQLDQIAGQIDKLDALHGSLTEILSVYAGIGDITNIGENIAPLLAVQAQLVPLTEVYANLSYITSIAPQIAAITAIGAAISDVQALGANINAIAYVAANLEDVLSTIGGVDGVINTRMATQAEALAATSDIRLMSPIRVSQFLTSKIGTAADTVAAGNDTRITGAAQKSSNLSDLASVVTARTNLGLGSAATLNVGTTAGTVAAGNDSRFSNIPVPASQAEAAAATDNNKYMTALRVGEVIIGKFDKTGGVISGVTTFEAGINGFGSLGSWSANGWATPMQLTQGQGIQWKKGSGEFSYNVGITGDAFLVNRKTTDTLDGSGAVTSIFGVDKNGVITTNTYGNLGTYIDTRAASYASSAQAAAISTAAANANAGLNSRVSSVALGGSWSGVGSSGSTIAPAGGVLTSYLNTGSAESSYGTGKYIYYYLPSTGWIVAGNI